jgi:hypothetical protein
MLWYIGSSGGIPAAGVLGKVSYQLVLVYLIKTKWFGQCPQHTVWEEHRIRIAAAISATG